MPMRWLVVLVAALAAGLAAREVPGTEVPGTSGRSTFEYRMTPQHQQLFRDVVAVARPEAQALIARVAPMTSVSFDLPSSTTTLGVTRTSDGRSFTVDVDLGGSMAAGGRRAVERVILHELGHVVDFALLSEDQRAALDAHFPQGYACPPEGCADRRERFAETFAKWALGDIGASLYVGYAVPPPVVTLDSWGDPLRALAG